MDELHGKSIIERTTLSHSNLSLSQASGLLLTAVKHIILFHTDMKVKKALGEIKKIFDLRIDFMLLATCFSVVSCLAYCSTLNVETCSSEKLVAFQRTTRCYIPQDRSLHNHRCENLKS
jgi:hypothetical protein